MARSISNGRPDTFWIGALLFTFGAGCAATPAEPVDSAGAIAPLTLEADGDRLRLDAAPANPRYAARYPNPEDVDAMTVRVTAEGEAQARCEAFGTETPCRANPFHTFVERREDGRRRVEVRDMYGELVAEGVLPDERAEDGDGRRDPSGSESTEESDLTDEREGTPSRTDESGYTGEVGVVVDTFEGSFDGSALDIDTGVVTASQSSCGSERLRIDIGQRRDESSPEDDDREAFEESDSTGETYESNAYLHIADGSTKDVDGEAESSDGLSADIFHVSAAGRGYVADHTGRHRGVVTHLEREQAAGGATRRVHIDAVWPDGSWARLVFRYNSASSEPPAPMPEHSVSAQPSWNEFRDSCSRPTLKQQVCDGVNAELAAQGLGSTFTFDCSSLPDHPAARPDPVGDRNPDAPLDGCAEVLDPPLREIAPRESPDACLGTLRTTWEEHGRAQLVSEGVCLGSPIVLDLGGDGIALTDLEGGVAFDLFGSGEPVQTAWTAGDDDAFLVYDLDGDGLVAGAEELFGHATGGDRYADGFEPLAALDDNGDGVIDAADEAWSELAVWIDANHDGSSDHAEVRSLEQAGIASLSVEPRRVEGEAARDAHGNRLSLTSTFTLAEGGEREMVDAFLRYRPLTSEPRAVADTDAVPRPDPSSTADVAPLCAPAAR